MTSAIAQEDMQRKGIFFTFAEHMGRYAQLFGLFLTFKSRCLLGEQRALSSKLHDLGLYP